MSNSSRFAVAVHVLTLMARAGDEPVKSEQVAESVNTNPVVIRRILCALAEGQLVVSQTGAAGGSRLARAPRDISLLDVHRAVEGRSVFGSHRQRPSRHCFVGVNIETVLEEVHAEVGAAVETVLSGITIEDVLRRVSRLRRCGRPAAARGRRC